MTFNFLRYKKIYFIFSGILAVSCIYALAVFGLNPGIDFTGGSILELTYQGSRPAVQDVRAALLEFGQVHIQPTDQNGLLIRMGDIDENTHRQVLEILGRGYEMEEQRFESIGPVIGKELRDKTKTLIALALAAIVLYVAFAFRKVQRPIRAWQYGLVALFALFHDILIPVGVFAILGKYWGVQITIPVVTALLTVLGYSVNNTVVVFDRVRENIVRGGWVAFEDTVNASLNQTLTRCISTSLTTLFVLLAIYFFGGETLRYFALTLIIGVAVGTYSSLFLATPVLVFWLKWRRKIS